MQEPNVGIYLDFENLAISAETVYTSQDKPLIIEPLIDFAASKGNICIRKAYADWTKQICGQYQSILMEGGFELVHMPDTNLQGKNGVDVRLAVDVMDNLANLEHIGVMIIGSGDSDFIPLIQHIKAKGVQAIVIGFEHSVARLIKKNSIEFKSLEDIIGEPDIEGIHDYSAERINGYGRELIVRFIKNHNPEEPILLSSFKQSLLRMDPEFSEKDLGYSSFTKFLQAYQGDVVQKIDLEHEGSPVVYLSEIAPTTDYTVNSNDAASSFLNRKMRFQRDPKKRMELANILFQALNDQGALSMNEMFEIVQNQLSEEIPPPKTEIKKYINTLFTGKAFTPIFEDAPRPLLTKPFKLHESITQPEKLDQVYILRMVDILQNKYPSLTNEDILDLLI